MQEIRKLYSPFILAQTAIGMDLEPTIFFLEEDITVAKKGEAEKTQEEAEESLQSSLESVELPENIPDQEA